MKTKKSVSFSLVGLAWNALNISMGEKIVNITKKLGKTLGVDLFSVLPNCFVITTFSFIYSQNND